MAFVQSKSSLLQTSVNVSATVTAALISAGKVDTVEGAAELLDTFKDQVYSQLVEVFEAEAAAAPAQPQRSYGGPRPAYSGGGSYGAPAGDPLSAPLTSGKYAGRSIMEVLKLDPDFVKKCAEGKFGGQRLQGLCKQALEAAAVGAGAAPSYLN